jgi:hypothetical protein
MKQKLLLIGLLCCLISVAAVNQQGIAQDQNSPSPDPKQNTLLSLTQIDQGYVDARSLYVTSQPRLFVVETGRHRFLELDGSGHRLDSVGNQGFGNYQFDRPLDIDATNGLKIYVSDFHNGRIQVFDRRLQFLSSITPPAGSDMFFSYQPTILTVSDNRELFFYETDSGRLVQYNENGELLSTIRVRTDRRLSPPADLTTLNGQLMLADTGKNVIHVLKPEGQYVRFIGGLNDIVALDAGINSMWVLCTDSVSRLGPRGRVRSTYRWSRSLQPVDIGMYKNKLYILTGNSLWVGNVDPQSR